MQGAGEDVLLALHFHAMLVDVVARGPYHAHGVGQLTFCVPDCAEPAWTSPLD